MSAAVMLQGTGSDVGKSLLSAGLCRAYTRRGLKVRPFKPQNMSNNAAVTVDGGEIGRAQALQARACGVPATVAMNPVLLKPETDIGAQVIVRGKRVATLSARAWAHERLTYLPAVLESYHALAGEADLVIAEGAGSPAEINLRERDIANMGFAAAARMPVALIGDIHRGGVIASIVGTMEVIDPQDAARIKAFIINNFHGDPSLFDDGVRFLRQRTGLACLGVVPHFAPARNLPQEDAVALERASSEGTGALHIAVPRLSRIANFDDLDPLRLEEGVKLTIVQPGHPIPADARLIILPGTKSTIADMRFLAAQGWDVDIAAHVRRGGHVLGLCGGYQLLGREISDPGGIEGAPSAVPGLGLLDIVTELGGDKMLAQVSGTHCASRMAVSGYEIHLGRSEGADRSRPFALIGGREEGATSRDGRICGTYLHGLFSSDGFRQAFLSALGASPSELAFEPRVEETLDRLADHLESCLDLDRLLALARAGA
ncbi:MAG: cobyric acid synthase [Rhodobiaceae bacterium]|nr:cobyric acid synthase [Rhodobiaceae bacterium]